MLSASCEQVIAIIEPILARSGKILLFRTSLGLSVFPFVQNHIGNRTAAIFFYKLTQGELYPAQLIFTISVSDDKKVFGIFILRPQVFYLHRHEGQFTELGGQPLCALFTLFLSRMNLIVIPPVIKNKGLPQIKWVA